MMATTTTTTTKTPTCNQPIQSNSLQHPPSRTTNTIQLPPAFPSRPAREKIHKIFHTIEKAYKRYLPHIQRTSITSKSHSKHLEITTEIYPADNAISPLQIQYHPISPNIKNKNQSLKNTKITQYYFPYDTELQQTSTADGDNRSKNSNSCSSLHSCH